MKTNKKDSVYFSILELLKWKYLTIFLLHLQPLSFTNHMFANNYINNDMPLCLKHKTSVMGHPISIKLTNNAQPDKFVGHYHTSRRHKNLLSSAFLVKDHKYSGLSEDKSYFSIVMFHLTNSVALNPTKRIGCYLLRLVLAQRYKQGEPSADRIYYTKKKLIN